MATVPINHEGSGPRVAIYCTSESVYIERKTNSLIPYRNIEEAMPRIRFTGYDFLSKHGFNVTMEDPEPYGVAAGGIGFIATSGRFALAFAKAITFLKKIHEKYAYSRLREYFPNVVIRLEILENTDRLNKFPTGADLQSAQNLIAILNELSEHIKQEYPLYRVEYLVIAPKGVHHCFSIYMPDYLITNINILKVIKALSSKKAITSCSIFLSKHLLLFSKVSFKTPMSGYSNRYNMHHIDCGYPQYEEVLLHQKMIKNLNKPHK